MLSKKKLFLLILFFIAGLTQNLYASSETTESEEDMLETGEGRELEQEYPSTPFPAANGNKAIAQPPDKNQLEEQQAESQQPILMGSKAKVIALNKTTAKSSEITLKVGDAQYFGNVEIKIHKCSKSLDPYSPDNKILLTITEHKIDEDPLIIFQGWMMSSNISVSTLEHPVYEIFAKECW